MGRSDSKAAHSLPAFGGGRKVVERSPRGGAKPRPMFTGLVQQIGRIQRTIPRTQGLTLEVGCSYTDLQVGESVAVNGACLTVVRATPGGFLADVSRESAHVTTLSRLVPGRPVNLERALRLCDRLGGHLVSGHVDGLARLLSLDAVGEARHLVARFPQQLAGFIAPKGSVTLDGVSLTVNTVDEQCLSVMIVPHTWTNTTLSTLAPGSDLNIEVDLLARYVARLREVREPDSSGPEPGDDRVRSALERAGFL